MKKILIILLLLPTLTKAQVYKCMDDEFNRIVYMDISEVRVITFTYSNAVFKDLTDCPRIAADHSIMIVLASSIIDSVYISPKRDIIKMYSVVKIAQLKVLKKLTHSEERNFKLENY